MFQRLAPLQRNVIKAKRDVLAFGMWNTIEEQDSDECIDLLMTKIVSSSLAPFSLIKLNMESSLFNGKISLTCKNFNSEKRGPGYSVNSG